MALGAPRCVGSPAQQRPPTPITLATIALNDPVSHPRACRLNYQDSSTSNEIFSRRRGLQQHQRSIQAKAQLPFDRLLAQGSSSASPAAATNQTLGQNNGAVVHHHQASATSGQRHMSTAQRQMEENKRKYVQQHQATFKSPTLSLQKANQIKAKLGLLTGTSVSSRAQSQRAKRQQHPNSNWQLDNQSQQASMNTISTLDPNSNSNDQDDINRQNDLTSQGGQLIGAPLNSIPKTDFECTDKEGRFVSGLFADTKTGCQVWHLCSNNRKYSFLCPSGTIFNAKLRICDWRYNVKCENTLPI